MVAENKTYVSAGFTDTDRKNARCFQQQWLPFIFFTRALLTFFFATIIFSLVKAIITIFKTEFTGKDSRCLDGLYDDVKDIGDVMIYRPARGKLFEFLNVLRANKIAYGTHFDSLSDESG